MLFNPNPFSLLTRTPRRVLLLLLLALAPSWVFARQVEDMYRIVMPVPDQSTAVRNAVFNKGLETVLVRVSGKRDIIETINTGSASSYVQTFTYLDAGEAEGTSSLYGEDHGEDVVGVDAEPTSLLDVVYSDSRILKLLRTQQFPVWGERRAETVLWLAVRDGVNRYLLADGDQSLLRDAAEDASVRRGLPLVWPLNDLADRQQMGFADAWAAFEKPVRQASQRYGRGPIMVGRMSWNGDRWTGDWSVFVDDQRRNWSLSSTDYSALINEAIDLSADFIAGFYAVVESPDEANMVMVDITRLDALDDFRSAQRYLAGLAAVRSVAVDRIDDDRVRFRLDLRGDIDAFTRSVSGDRVLKRVAGELQTTQVEGDRKLLQYTYRN